MHFTHWKCWRWRVLGILINLAVWVRNTFVKDLLVAWNVSDFKLASILVFTVLRNRDTPSAGRHGPSLTCKARNVWSLDKAFRISPLTKFVLQPVFRCWHVEYDLLSPAVSLKPLPDLCQAAIASGVVAMRSITRSFSVILTVVLQIDQTTL